MSYSTSCPITNSDRWITSSTGRGDMYHHIYCLFCICLFQQHPSQKLHLHQGLSHEYRLGTCKRCGNAILYMRILVSNTQQSSPVNSNAILTHPQTRNHLILANHQHSFSNLPITLIRYCKSENIRKLLKISISPLGFLVAQQ